MGNTITKLQEGRGGVALTDGMSLLNIYGGVRLN